MCQIYKLPNEVVSVQCCHGDFFHYKNPKNNNGLTSLYLATFPSEFTIVKMQQSCEVELVHGLTPLHLAAFLRE